MHIDLNSIPVKEVFPGYHGQFVHGQKTTLAFWKVDAEAAIPEHSHHHEQTMQVLEGEFELVLNGEPLLCKAGSIIVIPSNVPHSGKALTHCRILDTFTPVGEEYKLD